MEQFVMKISRKKSFYFLRIMLAIFCSSVQISAQTSQQRSISKGVADVIMQNKFWRVRVDPVRFGLWSKISGATEELNLTTPADESEKIEILKKQRNKLSWRVPQRNLEIEVVLVGKELSVRFTSRIEQTVKLTTSGVDSQSVAAIFPESEGLYIPLRDEFWLKHISGSCHETYGGTMPFWGIQFERATIAYLLPDDLRSKLCFDNSEGKLSLKATHDFLQRDGLAPYELKIVLTENSPIAPALEYRKLLRKTGRFVSFDEKVKRVPEARKLLGAMHGYLWGTGRTPEAMEQLAELSVEQACLSYDQDPRNKKAILVTADTIAKAKSLGYLIGPYDSFDNVQNPKTANSVNGIFDEELYQTGGVMKKDGTRQKGFAGFGYELSSEALKRSKKPFISERVNSFLQTGINSYFLDVDATGGDLRDDYDPLHPMTIGKDRENRLERMSFISQEKKLVLGSESAAPWSVPVIHFSHGTLTPKSDLLWSLLRNRELMGGYYPPLRPQNKFKTVDAPADFATFTFDPKYRLPLYEAVFHDSVIALDFWGVPLAKFGNLIQTRSLLLQLYNVPSMWNLDQKAIEDNSQRIKAMNDFFAPLHRQIGNKPLIRFEWLTPDRMVQQTQFGDEIILTANFSQQPFGEIPFRCIQALRLKTKNKKLFCPAT